MADCRGVLAAQTVKPQARVLAEARGIDWVEVDLQELRGEREPALTLPVQDGRLALGTWQGVYLCEHRDRGGPRSLVVTLHGE